MKIVIEHLEPKLYKWCLIEYKHISKLIGKNSVIFTNIKPKDKGKLSKFGKVYSSSVKNFGLKKACVLDPYSQKTLKPGDKKRFDCFIFGGILGNDPGEGRTKKLTLQLNFTTRNLGGRQLATDTAVFVTKLILLGTPLEKIKFQDNAEIEINDSWSVILPYPYVVQNGKVMISGELVQYLKKKKGF